LTDDKLATLIRQFIAKLPDAGQRSFVVQVRASGHSVSGGPVRALWKAARTKPRRKAALAAA
jgi:hypothetical protein